MTRYGWRLSITVVLPRPLAPARWPPASRRQPAPRHRAEGCRGRARCGCPEAGQCQHEGGSRAPHRLFTLFFVAHCNSPSKVILYSNPAMLMSLSPTIRASTTGCETTRAPVRWVLSAARCFLSTWDPSRRKGGRWSCATSNRLLGGQQQRSGGEAATVMPRRTRAVRCAACCAQTANNARLSSVALGFATPLRRVAGLAVR